MEHPVEGLEYIWKDGSDGKVYTFSDIDRGCKVVTMVYWRQGSSERGTYKLFPYTARIFRDGGFTLKHSYQENV